jgi:GxxExxY protein
MSIEPLTKIVIGCAYKVHKALGAGFLEKVYENALMIEIEEAGLDVRQQAPITVYYRGRAVGEYFADLMVGEQLILEIKAIQKLAKEHEVQLVHYLTATGIEDGLLINFGPSVEVKHKYRTYRVGKPVSLKNDDPV